MTVKELIKELEKLPEDSLVVISKDGEGNGFSPLAYCQECIYVPESTWDGEIYPTDSPDEEDIYDGDDGGEAVVLWPIN